jgi:hypothetical protein
MPDPESIQQRVIYPNFVHINVIGRIVLRDDCEPVTTQVHLRSFKQRRPKFILVATGYRI